MSEEKFVIEDGVLKEYTGEFAFSGCFALEGADLPAGLEEIGDGAFNSCSLLTRIVIPRGVKEIAGGSIKVRGFREKLFALYVWTKRIGYSIIRL